MKRKIYLCDPHKNVECSKEICQKLCFQTLNEEYAMRDNDGLPIAENEIEEPRLEFEIRGVKK